MATPTNDKALTLKDLIKAHQRGHAEVDALSKQVQTLASIEFATDEEVTAALDTIYGPDAAE